MFIALILSLLLSVQTPSTLSPEAQALVGPVLQRIEAEEARQAALPPPGDDREKLARMRERDQLGRRAMSSLDLSSLPETERRAAHAAVWGRVSEIDEALLAELLAMLPEEGWFTRSRYGDAGSQTAFLIVQHSNVEMWRRFVPVLEPLVATGEVNGGAFALMYDRLEMSEGRPQRYGSQMQCENGRFKPYRLEDPARVDEWRASMGLSPLADYQAIFDRYPPCD